VAQSISVNREGAPSKLRLRGGFRVTVGPPFLTECHPERSREPALSRVPHPCAFCKGGIPRMLLQGLFRGYLAMRDPPVRKGREGMDTLRSSNRRWATTRHLVPS
jgi:hypothetical protein